MSTCRKCNKEVASLNKDWHLPCLKCENCEKMLPSGGHAEHEGKPYCNHPCYATIFEPKGFGQGGAENYTFKWTQAPGCLGRCSEECSPHFSVLNSQLFTVAPPGRSQALTPSVSSSLPLSRNSIVN